MVQKGKHPVMVFTFVHEDANWLNPKNGVLYETGKIYPITAWGFSSWFDRIKARAGLSDVRIHDIRRTAGGRVNRASGLVAASKLLGHSSITPTAKHYAHHTTDEQREAQERAHIATRQRRERMRAVTDSESDSTDCQGFAKVVDQN